MRTQRRDGGRELPRASSLTLGSGVTGYASPAPFQEGLFRQTFQAAEWRQGSKTVLGTPRLFDQQTHLVAGRPDWGNPVVGSGDIYRATSGLGAALDEQVMAAASEDARTVPMLQLRVGGVTSRTELKREVAQLAERVRDCVQRQLPVGVGELEWTWPYQDVAFWEGVFHTLARSAQGAPLVVDLHTGLIEPSAVEAVEPGYTDWLEQAHALDWRVPSRSGPPLQANSALAHDPTPLGPLLGQLARAHPNVTVVLSHPFNPVGPARPNPSVRLALALPNVLLGTSARRDEQERLLSAAVRWPLLFDRLVFQSDGGGGEAALWLERRLLELTGSMDVVDRVLYRNAARAYGLGPG